MLTHSKGRGFVPRFNRIAFFGVHSGPWGGCLFPPLHTRKGVSNLLQEACREVRTLGKTPDPSGSPRYFLSTPPYAWTQNWGSRKIAETRSLAPLQEVLLS